MLELTRLAGLLWGNDRQTGVVGCVAIEWVGGSITLPKNKWHRLPECLLTGHECGGGRQSVRQRSNVVKQRDREAELWIESKTGLLINVR